MSLLATTPGKLFVMPRKTRGGFFLVGSSQAVATAPSSVGVASGDVDPLMSIEEILVAH
jgi:hypothetical protein